MNEYKSAYTQYKLTGDPAFKTAYQNAQKWIEMYIDGQESKLTQNKEYIDAFVQKYSQTNPEIVSLHKQFRKIQYRSDAFQPDM